MEVIASSKVWRSYPKGLYDIEAVRGQALQQSQKLCNAGDYPTCVTYARVISEIDPDVSTQYAIAKPACDRGKVPYACLMAAGQFSAGSSEQIRYYRMGCRGAGALTPGFRMDQNTACMFLRQYNESP
jgi:hypothetical protein